MSMLDFIKPTIQVQKFCRTCKYYEKENEDYPCQICKQYEGNPNMWKPRL